MADIRTMWPAVIEAAATRGRAFWARFDGATPVSFSDGLLAVGIPDIGRLNSIKSANLEPAFAEVVSAVMGGPVQVDAVLGSTSASATATAPVAAEVADVPSLDDPDAQGSDLSGESLAIAELGATVIGEITEG